MGVKVRELLKMISAAAGQESTPEQESGEQALYREYLRVNSPTDAELEEQRSKPCRGPLFTLLLSAGDCTIEQAEETLGSLSAQTYGEWELYVELMDPIGEIAKVLLRDARVRIIDPSADPKTPFWEAERLSAGEFFLMIDPGDTLPPETLAVFAAYVEEHPEAAVFYADEDERSEEGERINPEFKPDFSPETLMSYDVTGRPLVIGRSLWMRVGGLNGYSAAAEYDLALRVCLAVEMVGHIRKPLYTRFAPRIEPDPAASRESLRKALKKQGYGGYAMSGIWKGSFRVRGVLKSEPLVSLIVPGGTEFTSLRRLLESIDDCTTYENYELIVVDAGAGDAQLLRYYEALRKNGAARVLPYPGAPDLAAMLNHAAREALGDVLVFLSPEISVISPDWLETLLETLQRPGVGAVGPKLLTEDGRIACAGYVVGLFGWFGSPYAGGENRVGSARRDRFINTLRNVSLLSAECLAVSAAQFFNAGAFDESFQRYGFETEFCLRLLHRGIRLVYTPFASLTLHRGFDLAEAPEKDKTRIYDAIRSMLCEGDPHFSPNYNYALADPTIAPHTTPALYLNPNVSMI